VGRLRCPLARAHGTVANGIIANYDPVDAVARLKAAGLTPRREGGRVYFDDPDGIECQVASA